MNKAYLKLENVSLEYPVYNCSSKSFQRNILSLLSAGQIDSTEKQIRIRALNTLSIEINSGDKVGLIGGNGAGKSTLLRVLSDIYSPSSGQYTSRGRKFCILGTGHGMDDNATGYENIVLCGVSSGLSLKEIKGKIEDIENFTELGDYLNMPIRTYSSGMRTRLAFAVATCLNPDILLIDEGIGAGDSKFIEKAQRRLEKFMSNVEILVLASHSTDLIKSFCNKVLYLNAGNIEFFGNVDEGINLYAQQAAAA